MLVRKLVHDYGTENVQVTGHSLGGTIATELHDRYTPNNEIHVFKPGVGPGQTLTENSNVHTEIATLDPVNMFGNTGPNTTRENGFLKTAGNLYLSTVGGGIGGLAEGLFNYHSSEH
eukprot:CFRG4091T1